jgi:transposase
VPRGLWARRHLYITLAAYAVERRVLPVAEGRSVETVATLAGELKKRGRASEQASKFDKFPFDKFHVVWHASAAMDKMHPIEQRTDRSLNGICWSLLKDRSRLSSEAATDLDALLARMTTVRTARAWLYKEQSREILDRKQINIVRATLQHWCTCVMRSKVEPMKEVAALMRNHLEGIVAWAQTRQTNASWRPSMACSTWPSAVPNQPYRSACLTYDRS